MTQRGICASCLVLLVASFVSAELPTEVAKDLDTFVGDWLTEIEIDGKVYRGLWVAQWSDDRTCLDTYWTGATPDGPAKGTRIQGWDVATKKVVVVDFSTNGSSTIERYSITKNRVSEGTIAGVDEEGKRFDATARTQWIGPDRFTWTVKRGGDTLEYTFHRVNQVTKPVLVPAEARKALDYFVGTWKVNATREGKPSGEATWETYWAKGKPCLHCTQTWKDENGVDLGAGMWGYNISENQLVYTQYYVTGANATLKLKMPQEGIKPGTKLVGTIEQTMADGTTFESPTSIEIKSTQHYISRVSEHVAEEGKKLPGAELHFRKE